MRINKIRHSAFTLFEVLIVIGILLATSLIVAPITLDQVQENKVEAAANQITSDIFLTQQYSYTAYNDSAFGIRFLQNSYIIFSGTNYASATNFEEILLTDVSVTGVDFGGTNDLLFPKGGLSPASSGSITISSGAESKIIIVNSEGMVDG